ncbi:MAG: helix-turn-helix domain-containing protein [Segniliparus sp.]|uniref:helix-turn-helix domain-containing protein n=1 Tax=Segniliparus sp. TaxID=2804064 RepID=UPI003F321662
MEEMFTSCLYPIPKAREALGGISTTTVYELAKQGEIVKVNIGRRGFITAESITEYIGRLACPNTASIAIDAQ